MGSPKRRPRLTLAGAIFACLIFAFESFAQDPGATRERSLDEWAPREVYDSGQERPAPPLTPPPARDADRPKSSQFLFGDARGFRSDWEERGATFYTSFSQFEQGVASGGFSQGTRWGGKFDMLAHFDSAKMGLWEGGMFDLFAESRLGQSIDAFAGTYSPPNLAMFFPVPDEQVTAITGLKFTHEINERAGLYVGKLNALNGDRERFLKYPLTSRFWNAAFNFNLALDRYPYSTLGAGGYLATERGPTLSVIVLDSHDAPRTSGFRQLGANGAFLYSELKQRTNFFGLPGAHTLGGLYGSGSFEALAPASFIELPDQAVTPLKSGTWTLLWNFEQRLWVDGAEPERGLGFYAQLGLGDGDPNPVRGFLSFAINGNSPIRTRRYDTFGVGYYSLALSSAAKNAFEGLRDESGVELFYNLRVARGCHLTPDIQLTRPGLAPVDTAIILGLRLKVDF